MHLGAGRKTKDDVIEMTSGILLNKKIGDKVNIGDKLLTIYTNKENYKEILSRLEEAFEIVEEKVSPNKLIYEIIS